MTARRVELLYFDDCPSCQRALDLVREVVAESDAQPRVDLIRIVDADDAVARRFLGSPTLRVDGRDIEPGAETRSDYSLACRLYRDGDQLGGLPPKSWLQQALECEHTDET